MSGFSSTRGSSSVVLRESAPRRKANALNQDLHELLLLTPPPHAPTPQAGYLCLISPIFVFCLLNFVSGVPLLERSSDKRWGHEEAYRAYKRETWEFFLLPAKRTSASVNTCGAVPRGGGGSGGGGNAAALEGGGVASLESVDVAVDESDPKTQTLLA